MKLCRICGSKKPFSEFYKSKGGVGGVRSECKPCNRALYDSARAITGKKWREENKEKLRELTSKWRVDNPEKMHSAKSKWNDANRERTREYSREYMKAKYETDKESCLQKAKNWVEKNRGRKNEHTMSRHAKKLCAAPIWANKFFIREIYELAARRTIETGTAWHVDHIVPLQGKTVCGLHVENNLQVIPAVENLKKHNAVWPDMP